MDRRERFEALPEALLGALGGWQANMWTALPGIIQSFDPVEKTCTVQPTIQARIKSAGDGSISWINLPILVDCPVFFPSGGGYTLTFPLAKDDECLIIFSSRCIDNWWQSGELFNEQAIMRMHDLSDGFIFAGVSSKPNVQPNISINSTQLRSDDGSVFVELKGNNINVTATGVTTITAPSIVMNGAVTVNGTVTATGEIIAVGTHLHTHTHGGVQPGGGTTGGPT